MIETLNYIEQQVNSLGIPYELNEWTAAAVYPYFVGELSETESETEDGLEEKTLMITGFTKGPWLDLIEVQEAIKKAFPPVTGKTAVLDDGSGIAVFFSTAFPVPVEDGELKKIQINLSIKLWKVG